MQFTQLRLTSPPAPPYRRRSLHGTREAVRGADGHWYLADETGKRPDVLHLSRDDSEANRHGGGGGDTVHRSLRLEER
ncbi:MAG: hypothetical protein NZT92_08665 [Abditibacteriales bacterium]|nr:hypothetical protein [Abditibacteriales bacterium]MDW8366160.1 hypothetical protein [Abditibacteriales bacterium]